MGEGNKSSRPDSRKGQELQTFTEILTDAYTKVLNAETAVTIGGSLKIFSAAIGKALQRKITSCSVFSNYEISQLSEQLIVLPIHERSSVMLEFLKKKGLEEEYLKILQPSK